MYNNECFECICCRLNNLTRLVYNLQPTKVTVGATTTLAPGSAATVSNSGTLTDVVLNFGIPEGEPGKNGTDGVNGITPCIGANNNWFIGTTDTGISAIGQTGPAGSSATVAVGTTTTLSAGSAATVTNTGTTANAIFNFGIPQGIQGTSGSSNNAHASLYGAQLNDTDLPSTVAPGARIPWKVLTDNESGLIIPAADNSYFKFTKTGRYLCTFSLRCYTKISSDNTVVNWGLYAQGIKKYMVTSASAFVTTGLTNISGVGLVDVTDLNEKYNLINNSTISIQVQGATAAQTFNDSFKNVNGVNMVDGMSCTFVRISDAPSIV